MGLEPDIVIFGALHRDWIGELKHTYRSAASNPVSFTSRAGGVGANVARAAVQSGQCDHIRLVTPCGESGLEVDLADAGFHGVEVCPVPTANTSTGHYVAIVDQQGELVSGFADTDACEAAKPVALLAQCPASARTVVLDANLAAATLESLVTSLPIVRCALAVSPGKARRWLALADKVDIFFCNRREAVALTELPLDSPIEMLSDALLTHGFDTHVLTDGAAPLIIKDQDGESLIDTQEYGVPESGNTVGAGDALAGASIAAVHAGHGLRHAVREHGLPAAVTALKRSL